MGIVSGNLNARVYALSFIAGDAVYASLVCGFRLEDCEQKAARRIAQETGIPESRVRLVSWAFSDGEDMVRSLSAKHIATLENARLQPSEKSQILEQIVKAMSTPSAPANAQKANILRLIRDKEAKTKQERDILNKIIQRLEQRGR